MAEKRKISRTARSFGEWGIFWRKYIDSLTGFACVRDGERSGCPFVLVSGLVETFTRVGGGTFCRGIETRAWRFGRSSGGEDRRVAQNRLCLDFRRRCGRGRRFPRDIGGDGGYGLWKVGERRPLKARAGR